MMKRQKVGIRRQKPGSDRNKHKLKIRSIVMKFWTQRS